MNQKACLKDGIQIDGAMIGDLANALKSLTTASEKDFETLKNYPWYKRLFDMVTLSNNREIHLANQISSVAQAQSILIEILIHLAEANADVSKLVCSAMRDIKTLSEHDLVLQKRVNTLNKVIFRIKRDTDIRSLSDDEKCILSGCLFETAKKIGVSSLDQRDFASIVQHYIGENAQMSDPFKALEGVDESSRKKILATCMEYMYLKSHSFEDIDEDVVKEFDLGEKTIKSIKDQIESVLQLNGIEGLFYRYQVDEVEDVDEFFDIDLDVSAGEPEIGPSPEPKQRIDIDRILHIAPSKVEHYENCEIHIKSFVKCDGSIEFKNCIIYYNEIPGNFNITLADKASLTMENCQVICKGNAKQFFVEPEPRGYRPSIKVSAKFSCLKDCMRFAIGDQISFERCSFENCIHDFVSCYEVFSMRDCTCLWNPDLAPYINKSASYYLFTCYRKCIVENCRFEQSGGSDNNFRNTVFQGISNLINITNCEFYNLGKAISVSIHEGNKQNKTIANTKFINCQDVLSGNLYLDNCIFEKCSNISSWNQQDFFYCQFIDITNRIAKYATANFNYCEFFNISDTSIKDNWCFNDSIFYLDSGSCLDHCIFDGISLEESLLIKTLSDCKKECSVSVKNSVFKNCYAKKGYLIEKSKTIYGWIWDTHIKTPVSIYKCSGLDNIRSTPATPSEHTIRTTNAITGATIGMLGVPIVAAMAFIKKAHSPQS